MKFAVQFALRRKKNLPYFDMKLFRYSLGRNVAPSGPNDVLDVQPIFVRLVTLPNTDLKSSKIYSKPMSAFKTFFGYKLMRILVMSKMKAMMHNLSLVLSLNNKYPSTHASFEK